MHNVPAPWVTPFLKWAGGKRWLVQASSELFPTDFNRYIEPFLGGASVFFTLQPETAILSDANEELITTYKAIALQPDLIAKRLKQLHRSHSKQQYYRIRGEKPEDEIERAVRFIYLNRTCYNGLYRVNLKGEFNVPIGTKQNVVMETDDWNILAGLLSGVDLIVSDFEAVIDKAGEGDFIFSDPPYTVKHNNNGFVKYNETIFAWSDQVRLCNALARAKKRGATVMCTNADHESIWALYGNHFNIHKVNRASVIGGGNQYRGTTSEVIIV